MANFFHETVSIGPLADVEVSIRGTHTYIGQNSKVDNFVKIKHVGGNGDIVIGENVYLNAGTVLYSGNGIKIGNDVLIGPNCSIVPSNHNFVDTTIPIRLQKFLPSKGGIIIEDDVWIGAGVTILDGAVIRKGCIIGANSLVKEELQEYTIYAGNPLQAIKEKKMKFTVLGATGFIGSSLCEYFKSNDIDYFAPERDYVFNEKDELGHIIYTIGLTADFRKKPFETVEAHVSKLAECLQKSKYHSFLYLSSTRVYADLPGPVNEFSSLKVNPSNAGDLYNISKLMGESICFSIPNDNIRIARLSNVIGNDFSSENFITSLLKEIKQTGQLQLGTTMESGKDYISIDDVVKLIYNISVSGLERIYNVASGYNTTNKEIIDLIADAN